MSSTPVQDRYDEDDDLVESEINWRELDLKKVLFWTSVFAVWIDSALYPAELVKTRMQVQSSGVLSSCPPYSSTWDAVKQIFRQEGVFGFFKGFPIYCAGTIPTQLLYFGSYEIAKDLINSNARAYYKSHPEQRPYLQFGASLLAGGLAELVSASVWVPNDVVSQRMQIQGPLTQLRPHRYASGRAAYQLIYRQEGLRGLYRGLPATLLNYIPTGAVSFASYEEVKSLLFRTRTKYHLFEDYSMEEFENTGLVNWVAGAASGVIASVTCSPLDVLKTRLQTQEHSNSAGLVPPRYTGIWHAAKTIAREEGVRAFYQGLLPRTITMAPQTGIAFYLYELIKRLSVPSP